MTDKTYKLLLVDDEKNLLNNLVCFFEDEEFSVLAADTGEMALDILAREKVDGVIVDIRLPGIDGNEVIILGHALQPETKFLIHTGSTDYILPDALREIGISENQVYLKPVMELDVLGSHLRKLARGQ